MNPEHHNTPEHPKLPSTENTVTLAPEKLIAILQKEVEVQQAIINEIDEITSTLGHRVHQLSHETKSTDTETSNDKIKDLLDVTRLAEAHEKNRIAELQKSMEASERRSFSIIKKVKAIQVLSPKDIALFKKQEKEQEELPILFDSAIKKYQFTLDVKETVFAQVIEKYKKDIDLLNMQLQAIHKGTPQRNEHVIAVEAIQDRNKAIEALQQELHYLRTLPPKKAPPTPDIEITDDLDIRTKLSSVHTPSPAKATVAEKEPKKDSSSFGKLLSIFGTLFGNK